MTADVAIHAVNLTITDVPIRDLMQERIGLPIFVDNDANVAALAEHLYGAGRGARNVVLLTIGTGIGGGPDPRTARSTAAPRAPRPSSATS